MDTEKNKKDQLKGQINAIRSGNRSSIMAGLKEIRMESNIAILPELFNLLLEREEDEEIVQETSSLLNDLKMQEAAPILAEALEDPSYEPISHILAAACWQNGLSYGKYAGTFVKLAISSDYETAIEAFTVLEEAVGEIELTERAKLVKNIKQGMSGAPEQKRLLLFELVKSIESYDSTQ